MKQCHHVVSHIIKPDSSMSHQNNIRFAITTNQNIEIFEIL